MINQFFKLVRFPFHPLILFCNKAQTIGWPSKTAVDSTVAQEDFITPRFKGSSFSATARQQQSCGSAAGDKEHCRNHASPRGGDAGNRKFLVLEGLQSRKKLLLVAKQRHAKSVYQPRDAISSF